MSRESEPRHKKTCLWGFRPGTTQTGLCSHKRRLEASNLEEVEGLYYSCSENRGADGYCTVDLLICFHICKNRFSHDTAHFVTALSR